MKPPPRFLSANTTVDLICVAACFLSGYPLCLHIMHVEWSVEENHERRKGYYLQQSIKATSKQTKTQGEVQREGVGCTTNSVPLMHLGLRNFTLQAPASFDLTLGLYAAAHGLSSCPLKVADVQNLILWLSGGGTLPRWIILRVIQPVITICCWQLLELWWDHSLLFCRTRLLSNELWFC